MIHHKSKAVNFNMTIFVQMLMNVTETCGYYYSGFIQEIRYNDVITLSHSLKTSLVSNKKAYCRVTH